MSRQAWFQRYFFVYWLVFAGFFLVNSTYRVYSFLHDRTDIWWTPLTMLVPLGTSQDRVAVYVRGNELQDLVGAAEPPLRRRHRLPLQQLGSGARRAGSRRPSERRGGRGRGGVPARRVRVPAEIGRAHV